MMAAGLLPVLAAVGSAVDIGRVYMVRAQMQAGVDAAALAGARSFGLSEERSEQVNNYFQANMPDGLLGSAPIVPDPAFQSVSGINRVKVDATTDLPMVFMKLFGIPTMNITVTATAEMQPRPLEVMVVLDDTGSMQTALGSGTRMSALKTAMYDFINILHQGKPKREDLAMGFVTYTVTTNVGKILKEAGVTIQERDGFTNSATYTGHTGLGTDPLGWAGCVENDQTVVDLSASATTMEVGAFDIDRILPGEDGRPGVRPYHYPPTTTPKPIGGTSWAWGTGTARTAAHYEPTSNDKNPKMPDGRRNNFYRLAAKGDMAAGNVLANKPAYRQHFYDFYIGLNVTTADITDDVIVKTDGTYYAPGSGDDWKVEYSRIPFIDSDADWAPANPSYGYPTRPSSNLKMPTPNWECPNPALKIAYGRDKTEYDDYITFDNYPLMPASGTLHHIGMLWGYRLLTRDDKFIRTIPSQFQGEKPLRALVFMTDGDTAGASDATWYGAYGNLREKRISSHASDNGKFINQVMYRFAKVCENAKRDGIEVYIVSLLATKDATRTAFRNCAGANFRETSTQSEIQEAFRQIAVDLVDLHLTK